MRAEILTYMVYLEGPEYPEYVMNVFYRKHAGTPKYRNMLGNPLSQSVLPNKQQKLPKIFGLSMCIQYSQEYLRQ